RLVGSIFSVTCPVTWNVTISAHAADPTHMPTKTASPTVRIIWDCLRAIRAGAGGGQWEEDEVNRSSQKKQCGPAFLDRGAKVLRQGVDGSAHGQAPSGGEQQGQFGPAEPQKAPAAAATAVRLHPQQRQRGLVPAVRFGTRVIRQAMGAPVAHGTK